MNPKCPICMSSICNNSCPMTSILSVDVYPFKLGLNIIRKQGRRYRITYFPLTLGYHLNKPLLDKDRFNLHLRIASFMFSYLAENLHEYKISYILHICKFSVRYWSFSKCK